MQFDLVGKAKELGLDRLAAWIQVGCFTGLLSMPACVHCWCLAGSRGQRV